MKNGVQKDKMTNLLHVWL